MKGAALKRKRCLGAGCVSGSVYMFELVCCMRCVCCHLSVFLQFLPIFVDFKLYAKSIARRSTQHHFNIFYTKCAFKIAATMRIGQQHDSWGGNVSQLVAGSNTSKNSKWITINFCIDFHGPLRMNLKYWDDALMFLLYTFRSKLSLILWYIYTRWIVTTFCTDIHGSQVTNPNDIGDLSEMPCDQLLDGFPWIFVQIFMSPLDELQSPWCWHLMHSIHDNLQN